MAFVQELSMGLVAVVVAAIFLHLLGKLWVVEEDSISSMLPQSVRGGIVAFWICVVAACCWGLAKATAALGRQIIAELN